MFDDSLRLHDDPNLLALLSHYAQVGAEDRTIWRDRLMAMEGVDARQLSALHGELIALEWIEQNTGQAMIRQDGTLLACYRITLNGLREYRQFHGIEIEEGGATLAGGLETPRKSKRRKGKSAVPEVVAMAASADPSAVVA